jgi:formate dehydrogenase gamma subunit
MKWKSRRKKKEGEEGKPKRYFTRWKMNQRVQHWIMIITFIILVVTGYPLKYEDSEISQAMVNAMGGWEMRSQIHHIAGVALVALGIYHVIMYLVIDRSPKKILPRKKDFKDFVQHMKHLFGKAERPKYDRYSWKEKFDYWAAFWGMVLMGVTGIIMMYPAEASSFFGSTGWVEVAWIAHSEEALLAVMAIAIWHMWNVHMNPKQFPMSKVWLTGKLSEEEMKEEHPVEYEDIISKEESEGDKKEPGAANGVRFTPKKRAARAKKSDKKKALTKEI